MKTRLRNILLISFWILFITFPLLGIKTKFIGTQATLTFRTDGLWLSGIICICGIIWILKGIINNILRVIIVRLKSVINTIFVIPNWVWILVLVVMVAFFPLMGSERDLNKYLSFLIETYIYIALALGLNIVVGMAGLLVLGYAAFFAIGAYSYAILSINYQVPFWVGLIIGGAIAGFIGILLGLPSIRLRGDYLAIVTLGFGEVVRFVLKNETYLTGGEQGLLNIAPPAIGSFIMDRTIHYYYLALIMVILIIFVVHRLNNSRIGRAWIAIREDETAAKTMGINTFKLKVLAFAASAFIAGFMGVLYAARMNYISPESFRFEYSVLILSMVILGGMGSVPGVILGAIILQVIPWLMRDTIPNLLRDQLPSATDLASRLPDFRLLIFGGVMVLMMIFRPQGLIGNVRRKIELGLSKNDE
jgi:branched-chain amino acid transport system permease protein